MSDLKLLIYRSSSQYWSHGKKHVNFAWPQILITFKQLIKPNVDEDLWPSIENLGSSKPHIRPNSYTKEIVEIETNLTEVNSTYN